MTIEAEDTTVEVSISDGFYRVLEQEAKRRSLGVQQLVVQLCIDGMECLRTHKDKNTSR